MNNSVALSILTMLCNHHLYLNIFFTPTENTIHSLSTYSIFFLLSMTWQLPICFLSLWIHIVWIFHISWIIQYVSCCIWLLSLSLSFQIHWCNIYQDFILVITDYHSILCTYPICLSIHCWKTFELFPPLGYCE